MTSVVSALPTLANANVGLAAPVVAMVMSSAVGCGSKLNALHSTTRRETRTGLYRLALTTPVPPRRVEGL